MNKGATRKNPYKAGVGKYATHNIIARLIGRKKTVLDVGCNTGYMKTIADKSNEFYGLDYMKGAVKEARKTYVDASEYNIENLTPLPWDRKFDVIILGDVLEHINNPEEALKHFSSYLQSDGYFIISVPNIANWLIRLKLLFGKFDYTESGIMDDTHIRFYTVKTTRELIAGAGLKVTFISGGASLFGVVIHYLPFLNGLLSSSIVVTAKKK